MSDDAIQYGDPGRLADLMGSAGGAPPWSPDDLGAILTHQLRAPLLFDLQRLGSGGPAASDPWGLAAARQIRSFGDLLRHPAPPRDLLALTKAFAKDADAGDAASLPPEVASILYFAAIAAALLRLGERITTLDDRTIAGGVAWALEQPWLAAELRPLFLQTDQALKAEPERRGAGA